MYSVVETRRGKLRGCFAAAWHV